MNLQTSEPCVGIAHLLFAFPRAAALIGCIAIGSWYAIPRGEECRLPSETLVDGGDPNGAVCVTKAELSLTDPRYNEYSYAFTRK